MSDRSICTTPFPSDVLSSEKTRILFNREARKKNYPITWIGDKDGGLVNIPDISLGEIQIDSGSDFKLTSDLVCELRELIEGKRLRVASETRKGLYVTPSHTLDPKIMNYANKAEQNWLQFVTDGLQKISLDQFGEQSSYNASSLENWMSQNGDADSRWHFGRMRVAKTPPLNPDSDALLRREFGIPADSKTESPIDYGNNFPWFEGSPRFNAMYPEDFTQEDKDYITQKYKDPDHPIRLPWTVVEPLADESQLAKLRNSFDKSGSQDTLEHQFAFGNPVSWFVRGREDKWYIVTNMAFHPRYGGDLKQFAQILREAAKLPAVNGQTLHPEFKQYTLQYANYLERGEFQKALEMDLNQTQGNLFFTYFPHEGYWPDGMKFPWMFEVGIREPGAGNMDPKEAEVFQWLEDKVAAIAKKHGLKYEARKIDTDEVTKSAAVVWLYRNGGFMRAYFREPLGHDYPKRVYKGNKLHRTVVIMDGVYEKAIMYKPLYRDLLDIHNKAPLRETDLVDFVVWHEGTHGTGARSETIINIKKNRSMSDVYGDFWGFVAEPTGDAGSVLSIEERYRRGLISKEDRNRRVKAALSWEFGRFIPKEMAKGDYFGNPDAPHLVGSNMFVGWCFKKGAVHLSDDGKSMVADADAVVAAVDSFFEQLTVYSLTDDLEGFKKFAIDAIDSTPDKAVPTILETKNRYDKVLVINRNPDRKIGSEVVK